MLLQTVESPFLWLSCIPMSICTASFFSIDQSMDTGYFHVLTIVNSAAMNTGCMLSFFISVFTFLGYVLRSGLAGSYGNSIVTFLRKRHTLFHSGGTNLHSHQWCTDDLFAPHSCQHVICSLSDASHSDSCQSYSLINPTAA